jgi:hypothetical protein
VFIESIRDVLQSTSFGGAAFTGMSIKKFSALASGAVGLAGVQAKPFSASAKGKILSDASTCAYGKNKEFLSGVAGLDGRQDSDVQQVYNVSPNTADGDMTAVTATLAMNAITGLSGPATWTLGGCDYHTGDQATGDAKDLEMGTQIGLAVELAYRKKRPFFFQLLTDGGNTASSGTRNWSADSAETCMTVIGYYDPKGPPELIRQQVGQYTEGQGADPASVVGSDPELVAHAVFANYLNVIGRLGDFHTFAPTVFTNEGDLDKVLIFATKAST